MDAKRLLENLNARKDQVKDLDSLLKKKKEQPNVQTDYREVEKFHEGIINGLDQAIDAVEKMDTKNRPEQ